MKHIFVESIVVIKHSKQGKCSYTQASRVLNAAHFEPEDFRRVSKMLRVIFLKTTLKRILGIVIGFVISSRVLTLTGIHIETISDFPAQAHNAGQK